MKKLIPILFFMVSLVQAQMWIGTISQPVSGCNLGCIKPRFPIGYSPNQLYGASSYYVTYEIAGIGEIDRNYPGVNLFTTNSGGSSLNHTFTNCFNFAADAVYDLMVCVHWDDGSGVWQSSCKTVSITSNSPVSTGNILGPGGFCSDGTGTSGTLNLAGAVGAEYNWYSQTASSGGWVDLNTNATTYNYSGLTEDITYKVVVKNGFCPSDSTTKSLTVSNPPTPGVLNEDRFVCKGGNSGCFEVVGSNAQNYSWYEDLGSGWSNTTIPNAAQYCYNNILISKKFRVALSNPGCSPLLTNEIVVTVQNVSDVGDVTVNPPIVCSDENIISASTVSAVTDWYNWQTSLDASAWSNVGTDAPNYTENNIQNDTYYRLIVQNGVCPPDTSSPLMVQVDQVPVAPSLIGDAVYCEGVNSGSIDQVGTSSGSQLIFEQSSDGMTWNGVPFTGSLNYNNLTQSMNYRLIYANGICKNDTSNVVSVQLDPTTVPGVLHNDSLICTGNSGELNLIGLVGDIQTWQSRNVNANSWTNINNPDTFLLFSNLTDTTLYRVIAKSGTCAADTSNIVTLDYVLGPDAGVLSGGGQYCIDNVNHSMSLSGYNGSIVDWEVSYDGTTFAGIGNPTDAYTANSLSQTVWYRVAVELNNCPYGYSDTVQIEVSSLTDPGTLSQDATFCEGDAVGFVNLLNYNDTILQFELSNNGGSSWFNVQPDIGRDTLSYNLTENTLFRALVKSGVCPSDYSNEVLITVNPLPQVFAGEDFDAFEGENFELNGSTDAPVFYWTPDQFLDNSSSLAPIGSGLSESTMFYITGEGANGCSKVDSVFVTLLPPDPIFDTITNAITVNNDGLNDYWYVSGIEKYPNSNVQLIDKWGREVFQQVGYRNDFDASSLPQGSYMYIISFEEFDKVYKGVISIFKE